MSKNLRSFSTFAESALYAQLSAFLLQESVDLNHHGQGWGIEDELISNGVRNELALLALINVASGVRSEFGKPTCWNNIKNLPEQWNKDKYLTNSQSALGSITGTVKSRVISRNPYLFFTEDEWDEFQIEAYEDEEQDEISDDEYRDQEWEHYVRTEILRPINEEQAYLSDGELRSSEDGWFYED